MKELVVLFIVAVIGFAGCGEIMNNEAQGQPKVQTVQAMKFKDKVRAFKKMRMARCIRKRESRNKPYIVSPDGNYHGLYQFSIPTWMNMGGAEFGRIPSQAKPWHQHIMAYRLYKLGGWSHWENWVSSDKRCPRWLKLYKQGVYN